jgi:hypothetical protein
MRRVLLVGMLGLVAAALAVAAAGVRASSAARTHAAAQTSTIDSTYSCKVRSAKYVDFDISVDFPPLNGMGRPAQVSIFTIRKTIVRNGTAFIVPQLYFEHVKDSLQVDTGHCSKSSGKLALARGSLPAPEKGTPSFNGEFKERCGSSKHVLVHFKLTLKDGTPQHALVAVRNDDKKKHVLAFFTWRPRKIAASFRGSCVPL